MSSLLDVSGDSVEVCSSTPRLDPDGPAFSVTSNVSFICKEKWRIYIMIDVPNLHETREAKK